MALRCTNSAVTEAQVDNININGNAITSTNTNGNITITPNGTGDVVIDGLNYPQADGSAGQFLKTDGSGQLSFATVASDLVDDTSPQLVEICKAMAMILIWPITTKLS